MVLKRFINVDIECWEHIADRRFGANPPFICLKGGVDACAVVLDLIDELVELTAPAQRSVSLKPTQRPQACHKIRFIISLPSEVLREMSLTIEADTAVFEFTGAGLQRFRDAAVRWQSGMDDFSIHPMRQSLGSNDIESGEVWFWLPTTEP